MVTTLNMLLQMRRDNVFTSTYVLQPGEPGFEISTNTLKIGDGTKTWAELDFANKALIDGLIAIVDQKVTNLGNVATDEEVEAIRKALQDAIDALALRVKAVEDDLKEGGATYGKIAAVEAKFADYKTAEAQKAIDDEQDRRIGVNEIDISTLNEIISGEGGIEELVYGTEMLPGLSARPANFDNLLTPDDLPNISLYQANFEAHPEVFRVGDTVTAKDSTGHVSLYRLTKIPLEDGAKYEWLPVADAAEIDKAITNITKDGGTIDSKISAFKTASVDPIAQAVENITKEEGLLDQLEAGIIGTAEDAANADTIYGAKKFAQDLVDAIPAQTDYTVTCTDVEVEATETTAAYKRHTLTQNGNTVCTIDVPRDLVLKSGYVDGESDELVLVLVNDEEIRVDVSHLIEYVTGDTAADGVITVNISDDFVATATINDGTITSAKFADEVDTYVDGRIDTKISAYNTATVAPIAAKVEGWDATKSTVDSNKATWDLAGTAVQSSVFEEFKTANSKAIEDAAKAGTDAAAAVAGDLAEYEEANDARVKAVEDAVAALDDTYVTETELEGTVNTINGEIAKKLDANGWSTEDGSGSLVYEGNNSVSLSPSGIHGNQGADYDYSLNSSGFEFHETTDYGGEIGLRYEGAEYSRTGIRTNLNGASHSYAFPEKSGTLALTSDVKAVEDKVDAIDVGVTQIVAGNDIVVTPEAGTGIVTVAHETFVTGEYTKDPATSDKTGDQYFFTGVTVDNGHVTGANVKSLASVLEGMTFVFDGGNSTSNI